MIRFSILMAASMVMAAPSPAQQQPSPPTVVATVTMPRPAPPFCENGCITPVEAVTYAAYLAPKGALAGDFEMQVKAVGQQRGMIYLNSEPDYRDRNCLTIAIPFSVATQFAKADDLPGIEAALKGRWIDVHGVAQQVRINFSQDGEPTGKYYYQTHVRVSAPQQIALAERQ